MGQFVLCTGQAEACTGHRVRTMGQAVACPGGQALASGGQTVLTIGHWVETTGLWLGEISITSGGGVVPIFPSTGAGAPGSCFSVWSRLQAYSGESSVSSANALPDTKNAAAAAAATRINAWRTLLVSNVLAGFTVPSFFLSVCMAGRTSRPLTV
jgi:hypothetical protein